VVAAVKPAPFTYLRPDTVAEALIALAQYGDDARVIAGGQSLGAMLNMRIVAPKVLIDIDRLSDLGGITFDGGNLVTGAVVRQSDAMADARVRENVALLAQALPYVGHYQTRNRGTLGGSVAHADPSAEIPLTLATLGGEIELRSKRAKRRIKARDFFRSALVTAREPDELVTAIYWPVGGARQRQDFVEFSVRDGDYAIVAVACVIDIKADGAAGAILLGFGGCGEVPQFVEINDLSNTRLDENIIESIARDAAGRIECRADLLGTGPYRRELASVLACRAIVSAYARGQAHA
jgi:CO/xanthine dehydrogenase FAD-binding subunit